MTSQRATSQRSWSRDPGKNQKLTSHMLGKLSSASPRAPARGVVSASPTEDKGGGLRALPAAATARVALCSSHCQSGSVPGALWQAHGCPAEVRTVRARCARSVCSRCKPTRLFSPSCSWRRQEWVGVAFYSAFVRKEQTTQQIGGAAVLTPHRSASTPAESI